MEKEKISLEETVSIRLFGKILSEIRKIVTHAKTQEGKRKYESKSHFLRCAIMRLVNEERTEIKVKKGRPLTYNDSQPQETTPQQQPEAAT